MSGPRAARLAAWATAATLAVLASPAASQQPHDDSPAAQPKAPAALPPAGEPHPLPPGRPPDRPAIVPAGGWPSPTGHLPHGHAEPKGVSDQGGAHKRKPKYPRDAHGYCIGQGPSDRPRDINLMHGWLGSKHALAPDSEWGSKAVEEPKPKGSAVWWKWRLIPYPWRYDNHEDHCDPNNEPVPLVASIFNLAILVYLLARFGKKPLAEALKKRKDGIMAEIEKARAIKQSARERLESYESQIENLDETLATLRAQYAADGEREERRVREELAAARDRLMADVTSRLRQEGNEAREVLSQEVLESALGAAREVLDEHVTAADHERLAEELLGQLDELLRKGDGRTGGES